MIPAQGFSMLDPCVLYSPRWRKTPVGNIERGFPSWGSSSPDLAVLNPPLAP